jgi:endonuclease/exonuclease/phosphatase family metal-dependent hydrolase
MKLLQFNLWLGRLSQQILNVIDEEQPDIITAQEVYRGGDTVKFPDNMFNIYDQINERYPYSHFSAAHSTLVAHSKADMGNAIFSKFPIIDTDDFFTSGEYVDDLTQSSYIDNSRTLQKAVLDINGTKLTVLNHHGYWMRNPLGNEESVDKMRTIATYIQALDPTEPLIFAGDFNVTPESPAMRPLDGILKDLIVPYAIPTTLSSLRNLGNIPCDHIMTNERIADTNLYTLDAIASDHKPVVLLFDITT